jgi:CHASE3 domain sensor protein
MCDCNPLEKLIATNFAYFRCPKCEKEYFSSGDARVIDKCNLGSIAVREQQLNEKARELGLPSPTINKQKLEQIQKIIKEDEGED